MLTLTHSLRNLTVSSYFKYETVRWRKPLWLPPAKSKLFKVPPRPVIPVEEKIELQRLYNNYRTAIKSLRNYLTLKYCTEYQSSADPEEQKKLFEEDFQQCMKVNDEWNEQRRVLREKTMNEELEANLAYARRRLEDELIKQEEKLKLAEEIVQREKEVSKNYILPENIDEAIDRALENTVDYNFALTPNGEKIVGYENNQLEENQMKEEHTVKQ